MNLDACTRHASDFAHLAAVERPDDGSRQRRGRLRGRQVPAPADPDGPLDVGEWVPGRSADLYRRLPRLELEDVRGRWPEGMSGDEEGVIGVIARSHDPPRRRTEDVYKRQLPTRADGFSLPSPPPGRHHRAASAGSFVSVAE